MTKNPFTTLYTTFGGIILGVYSLFSLRYSLFDFWDIWIFLFKSLPFNLNEGNTFIVHFTIGFLITWLILLIKKWRQI